jgi:DNA polymerase-3 subunit alpha
VANFVHLHCHTEFSLLDGLAKIPELLARAKDLGMDSLAITDHGSMYGVFKFYLQAMDMQIKPIIGIETYTASRSRFDKQSGIDNDQYHLILLAKNAIGYKNLLKLTTIAHLEGFYYKPRIDVEILRRYSEGLIGLSACLEGEIPYLLRHGQDEKAEQKAREFAEIFGEDNFYLEMQVHPKIADQQLVNEKLVALSKKVGLPLVATNDCHYVEAADAQAQEILLCVQTQHTILEKERPISMIDSPDFYLRSPEEMRGLFIQYPQAIENTVKIASKCDLAIEMGRWILPHFPVPERETPENYLAKLCQERLKERYPHPSSEVLQRMDYELSVISKKGYSTYFLIVQDFVNWAKKQGIAVGPGRGSVAGSLVSFVLRISDLDPIAFHLPFERFLNIDRPSPPDVDLDFADDRRDEVIAYVTDKYGREKVAQIITFGTMEARQAVRDTGRALGMPYAGPDRIAKMIPPGAQGFPMTIEKAIEVSPELTSAYENEPETKKLLDLSRKLEGVARHASTHAAGVVIADKDLVEYAPLQKEVKGEKIITQYDMYCLDLNAAPEGRAIGLLKMDFLGLRNLTILQNTIKFIKDTTNKEINLNQISLDDKQVFDLITKAETTGVFQLESSGMRRLARDLRPTKFSDISAMVALFRPGPMEWINDFVAAKKDPSSIKYTHPDLKPILSETYGIAVYQEQCMQIANVMAGYSLAEADRFRMAIGKKKRSLMEKEKEKFIAGCQKQGYSQSVAEKVFSLIEKFVGYGFNKAHSASYAMIAYQTAYMKVHFPVEFMTAVLTAESKGSSGPVKEEKLAQAVEECRRMKIGLLPPDINRSAVDFSIQEDPSHPAARMIRFGLSAIKNVGQAAIESILKTRDRDEKFTSLVDFCQRVDLQKVNRKTLESLIKAGAMDEFGKRAAMLASLAKIMEESHQEQKRKSQGQTSLFDSEGTKAEESLADVDEFSREEILSFERELLGFYLTEHPLRPVISSLADKINFKISELPDQSGGTMVKIGGVITQVKKILTRQGNSEMAFIKIEDLTGTIEVIVFPKLYSQTKYIWVKDRVVIVWGKLDFKEDRPTILVEKVEELVY